MNYTRPKFNLLHVMLLIAACAAALWYITQHKKKHCVAVIDKFRLATSSSSQSILQVQFHFKEPAELADQKWDHVVYNVPSSIASTSIENGTCLRFQYQAEATFLFERENAVEKFWTTLALNEMRLAPDIAEELFRQVFQN